MITVRPVKHNECEKLIDTMNLIFGETHFMLYGKNDPSLSKDNLINAIQKMCEDALSHVLIAIDAQNTIAGFCFAQGNKAQRKNHVAHIVIALSQQYTGQGIGKKLMQAIENWSTTKAISRMELTVITKNTMAINFYRKLGFVTEGTKQRSVKIEDQYYDELLMAKLLNT